MHNDWYSITTDGWIGYVTRRDGEYIWVSESKRGPYTNEINNYRVDSQFFELIEAAPVKEKEEINMEFVKEIINDEERRALLSDMKGLLDEYDYKYTDEALNKIIDTWATNKAELITAFKKHPSYLQGKFMIVFSHNFSRNVDRDVVRSFKQWLLNSDTCIAVREFMPEAMRDEVIDYGRKLPQDIFHFLSNIEGMTEQYIDEYIVGRFDYICPDIHAHKGQKMSRVVNKLLTYVGYNKLPDYNREFAKYADALNPLQITRHIKRLSSKYTLQEDGRYVVNVKNNVKLSCKNSWDYYDINSQGARDVCRWKQCATSEMKAIEDVFTKYPCVFDDMITVDKVIDNGFTERKEYDIRNEVHYKLKARNNITAVVNKLNIVDKFVIDYRSHQYNVMYSKKYNKLFTMSNGTYIVCDSIWCIPDTTFENIKAKIASLYN